jgi:uncharacterized membrane protein YjfL (UPF0719 family)
MKALLDNGLSMIAYLCSVFILFYIGKFVYQLVHKKINVKSELVDKDNFAFSLAHTGYFVGLMLAIGSVMMGQSHGFVDDMIDIFFYGIIAIVLLNLSLVINDKIILRKFSTNDEIIRDQNVGVGAIEAANSISTGLIILGAIYGEGGGWLTAVVFWIIGQVLLIGASFVYQLITPYNDMEQIEKDNVAAGIAFAGAIVAIANLIRFGLMHDFVSWEDSLITVLVDVAVGFLFLPVARFLTEKVLLSGRSITDEIVNQEKPNIGVGLIETFAYIGGSIMITWCL